MCSRVLKSLAITKPRVVAEASTSPKGTSAVSRCTRQESGVYFAVSSESKKFPPQNGLGAFLWQRRNPHNPSRTAANPRTSMKKMRSSWNVWLKARVVRAAGRRDPGRDDLAARFRHQHQRPVGVPCLEIVR